MGIEEEGNEKRINRRLKKKRDKGEFLLDPEDY